jgi:hypothetical protein
MEANQTKPTMPMDEMACKLMGRERAFPATRKTSEQFRKRCTLRRDQEQEPLQKPAGVASGTPTLAISSIVAAKV